MKDVRWIFYVVFSAVFLASGKCDSIYECLEKDSISCLQMQIFRSAREVLNQPSIDLMGGMSLVMNEEEQKEETSRGRAATNQELVLLEESVENATDVVSRQEAIENFLVRKARDVVVERTIRWDVGQTIRNIANSIPELVKAKFTNYVTEARGKSKKFMRILVPLLIGLKLKMAGLAALTYLGIAFLAKKAILASLISLIVSGFIGLKKLLSSKQPTYEEMAPMPYHPMPVWSPQFNPYEPHTDASSQKLAYGGYKTS